MLNLPFIVRSLRLISIKWILPPKLKENFVQNKLLDNHSLKKIKYEKHTKYIKIYKNPTFHQICSPRYHRHRYSKKKKIIKKWTNGMVQYRIYIQQRRNQRMFCLFAYMRKMITRRWNSSSTLLKFAQIEGVLFRIS